MAINLEKKGVYGGGDAVEAMLKDAKADALKAFGRSAGNYCDHGIERFPRGRTMQVVDGMDCHPWTVVGVREDGYGGYAVLSQSADEREATEVPPEVFDAEALVDVGRHMDEESGGAEEGGRGAPRVDDGEGCGDPAVSRWWTWGGCGGWRRSHDGGSSFFGRGGAAPKPSLDDLTNQTTNEMMDMHTRKEAAS